MRSSPRVYNTRLPAAAPVTDVCVAFPILSAIEPGYQVFVVTGALGDLVANHVPAYRSPFASHHAKKQTARAASSEARGLRRGGYTRGKPRGRCRVRRAAAGSSEVLVVTRVFLGLFGLLSVPYGIYCFARPGFLEGFAGVAAVSTTGAVELQAMYGGLQTGFGALALLGALRPAFAPTALLATAFLCAGLGLFRCLGAFGAGELSSYTAQGLVFELGSTVVAAALWRRGQATTRS